MTSSASKTGTDAADGAVVFLGLGANLGDRAATLQAAADLLSDVVEVDAHSPVYETEPFGVADQPHFLNAVLRGRTSLDPAELLSAVQDIERQLGRTRGVRMGPRAIDIDILMYGGISLEQEGLTIPHAGLLQRAFVLRPLLDIDPELRHPVSGELLRDRLASLSRDVRRMRRVDTEAHD